jgi:hypothetical protein
MGVKALREAFDAAADGRLSCQKALLDYIRQDGAEWQKLSFSGTAADGTAFSTQSELLPAKADVFAAATAVAQKLIGKGTPAP